jgi:hypothetical protein
VGAQLDRFGLLGHRGSGLRGLLDGGRSYSSASFAPERNRRAAVKRGRHGADQQLVPENQEVPCMTVPSIKGTAFMSVHADVQALLARGAIDRNQLELALAAEDLRTLDEKVLPSAWYPIATFDRMSRLLCDREGNGRVEYLIARGEKAADRIASSGIYQQLDASTENLGVRTGRIVVTVAGLIYNFTSWHFEREGATLGNFSIRVEDAADFPETARYSTQGFVQRSAERIVGKKMTARSERPVPGKILYHVLLAES